MQKVINHLPHTCGKPSECRLQDECSGIAAVNERSEFKELRVEKRAAAASPLAMAIMVFAMVGVATSAFCIVALIVLAVRHFLTH